MNMDTPILVITFNRPDHLRRVIEALRLVEPTDIYFFQDGPRNESDRQSCMEVRDVIKSMTDWSCSIHTYYSDDNLGCGLGPASAISWFFENVEQGIIIEDDTIPHPDFFEFATQLLNKYTSDDSVMAIGSMKLGEKTYGDGSYYFSKMNHTLCVWATWRRAWNHFDYRLLDFSTKELSKCLKKYGTDLREREYWSERLVEIHKDALDNSSWDQQFWMAIWRCHGKGILPNKNLSTNIGFDSLGTHTKDESNPISNLPSERILPIIHPSSTTIQRKADLDFQKYYFQPRAYGWNGIKYLPSRLNKRLKRLVGHNGPWFRALKNTQHQAGVNKH